MKTLLIVDVQNDFISGTLPVPGAAEIIPVINDLIPGYDYVIKTKDWHPPTHSSFKQWPVHCVSGTWGAETPLGLKLDRYLGCIYKGMDEDVEEYSAFANGSLERLLVENRITEIDVCGLATSYCVLYTVLDGVKAGYKIRILKEACRDVGTTEYESYQKMKEAGAILAE